LAAIVDPDASRFAKPDDGSVVDMTSCLARLPAKLNFAETLDGDGFDSSGEHTNAQLSAVDK